MSFIGDVLKRVTGGQREPQKAKAEPPKPQTPPAAVAPAAPTQAAPVPKWPPVTERVAQHPGPGPSPTARVLNKMPEVKAVGEAVYTRQVEPRPGPLAEKKATEKENIFQPRGTRPGPTVVTPGMGGPGGGFGGGRPAPRPPAGDPPPAPAPAPARKPPVKTFDQFIGAGKPGHKL